MKEVMTLAAKKREVVGSRASRRVRHGGEIPAVLYGHKQATASLSIAAGDLAQAVRHHTRMLDLNIEGQQKERVLLSALQYDAFGMDIIHADFIRVAMDELIRVKVPVTLKGKAKGETQGAVTEQLLTEVEVECLPANIPETLTHIITELDVGDSVKVSELKMPEGVKAVTDGHHLVVTVAALRIAEEAAPAAAAVVEEGAAAGAGPEVIARGKIEEEGAEGEAGKEEKKK